MTDSEPRFEGAEDPRVGITGVHRWYRFRRSDGTTARVGITQEAAAARRSGGDDDDAIDEWVIATGRRILADRPGDATNEVVLDVPSGRASAPDRDLWKGNTLREPDPGD
ncbi:MAG: hypothetical protein U0237_15220 [Thermoleophilia bacterium]